MEHDAALRPENLQIAYADRGLAHEGGGDRAEPLIEFETTFGDRLIVPKGHRRSCPESVLPIQQQS